LATNPIDDKHHVARHVRARLVLRQNGKAVACFPQAFELRPATPTREAETYLSASWFEFFDGDWEARLKATLAEISGYLSVKPKDALAIANVGNIKEVGANRGAKLRVLHEPDPPLMPAYAAIRGVRSDDAELIELLAAEAFAETVEVSSIK
jgi:hypothetical protein